MRMEITFAEVTIDQLYDDLGKLREVGFGGHSIEWHTSRSHIGKAITMTLVEAPGAAVADLGRRRQGEKQAQEAVTRARQGLKAEIPQPNEAPE